MAHVDSQSLPEQCEQPVTVSAGADDSDSGNNSARSFGPGVEPEGTVPEDCQWGDDLGMAALDEEVNQLLEGEIDSESVAATGNLAESTSIWYHVLHPLHPRPSLCVQTDLKRR